MREYCNAAIRMDVDVSVANVGVKWHVQGLDGPVTPVFIMFLIFMV